MSLYDRYILPELIKLVCSGKRFHERRQQLLPQAHGVVLDIGMGSGLNLPLLEPNKIRHIYGLEPNERLRLKAEHLANKLNTEMTSIANGAEDIPLDDNSIDTAVITFSMCTIPDIETALQEIRRVLKPQGQLLFCEHGQAPEAAIRKWQDRLNPTWKFFAGGCNLNRPISGLITEAGFNIQQLDEGYMKGPRPMSYMYQGSAISKT